MMADYPHDSGRSPVLLHNVQYNIHGLLGLQIQSCQYSHIKYIDKKYNYFKDNGLKDFDIEVLVAPFSYNKGDRCVRKGVYTIGNNIVYWKKKRKLASWKVSIEGFEENKLKIMFWGNFLSLKYLCMHIIEPAINMLLIEKDYILLHASAVELDGKALIFSAHPGGGKSSLAMYLLHSNNANLLSDEYVIISSESEVFCFYMPIALFDYNFPNIEGLIKRISAFQQVKVMIKKIIRKITLSFIKIPTYINIDLISPTTKIANKTKLDSFFILNRSIQKNINIDSTTFESFVNEVVNINSCQFRFFEDVLCNYLSVNVKSKVKDRFKKQHNIIINALRNKRIGNINMPCVSSLTEEDILLLTMSKLNRKENE